MPRGRVENLIVPTSEQARINGSKGGKTRAKNEADRKEEEKTRERIADTIRRVLNSETPEALASKLQKQTGVEASTMQSALIASVFINGLKKGDVRVLEAFAKFMGEQPDTNVNMKVDMNDPFKGLSIDELKKLAK